MEAASTTDVLAKLTRMRRRDWWTQRLEKATRVVLNLMLTPTYRRTNHRRTSSMGAATMRRVQRLRQIRAPRRWRDPRFERVP